MVSPLATAVNRLVAGSNPPREPTISKASFVLDVRSWGAGYAPGYASSESLYNVRTAVFELLFDGGIFPDTCNALRFAFEAGDAT
jgi:hypothetical protein